MAWRTHGSLVFVAVLLGSCGELREDGDYMCVEPVNCTLDRVRINEPDLGLVDDVCSEADYPANTPFAVRVWIQAAESEINRDRCWVEQTGEFELTIHSKWRERDTLDVYTYSQIECESIPALAPGTWTIIFGEEVDELVIPSEDAPVMCVPFFPTF